MEERKYYGLVKGGTGKAHLKRATKLKGLANDSNNNKLNYFFRTAKVSA